MQDEATAGRRQGWRTLGRWLDETQMTRFARSRPTLCPLVCSNFHVGQV